MFNDPPAPDLQARPLAEQAVRALSEQSAERAAEKMANEMAEKVVAGIFLHLGVDVNDKEAIKALRDDLSFLARMNRGAREIKSAAIKTCVGAVFAGLFSILIIGFKDWIFQK